MDWLLGRAAGTLDRSLDGWAPADDRLDLRVEFLLGEPMRRLQFLAFERSWTTSSRSPGVKGLVRKSQAPSFIASTAFSTVA